MKENNIKRNYTLRFTMFWTDLFMRTIMPLGVIAWQFGVFKDDVSMFSRVRGGFLMGAVISVFLVKKDILDYIKKLENKGWYKAVRQTLIWVLIFGILWFTHVFITEMLWVVGSFMLGSAQSLITEPIHQRQVNIIKEHKKRQDLIAEKLLEKELEQQI